jgi:hypothetical protein
MGLEAVRVQNAAFYASMRIWDVLSFGFLRELEDGYDDGVDQRDRFHELQIPIDIR